MAKWAVFCAGIAIGVQIMWVVWNLEFHFRVKETGIMKVSGQQYHVIPFDGTTP